VCLAIQVTHAPEGAASVNEGLKEYRGYIVILLVCLILIGGTFILLTRPTPEPITITPVPTLTPTPLPTPSPTPTLTPSPAPSPTPTLTPTPAPLRVHVSGAVRNPGVYRLDPGSIIDDAVEAAGGPTDDADLDHINLALELYDQQQVYVPRVGEPTPELTLPSASPTPTNTLPSGSPAPTPTAGEKEVTPPGKVNINTATVEQLDTLPGIGPAIAQRIVDYRQANGPFAEPEDIMNVSGIGPATFEKLQDLITVE
jgi:competence protein ComEA